MNFDFSDDQKFLKDQARRFLAEKSPVSAVRTVLDDPAKAFDGKLWAEIATMGWLGTAIPEEFGGLGLGHLELCVLAEEMGRSLAPVPFSSSLYFFAPALLLAGSAEQKAAVLPGVADGSVVGTVAVSEGAGPALAQPEAVRFDGRTISGRKIPVTDGDIATHGIVLAAHEGAASLVLVDLQGPGVTRTPVKTLDSTRSHAAIVFDAAPATVVGEAGSGLFLMQQVFEQAAVLIGFEQLGGAQACLEMATAYAKERHAFSRQIGSFQAIKHKLADVYVSLEIARSNAYFGAWALSTDAPELPLAAAATRVAACEAYHLAAKENIQTHGGMGFTWDVDCHLHYRRAKLLAVQAGSPAIWKERLVSRLEQRNAA